MNTELLERVLQRIEAHPEQLNMLAFHPAESRCGTACCVAGHTLLELGYKSHNTFGMFCDENGSAVITSDTAAEALDLTDPQRGRLFYAVHITTPQALRALVTEMIEEEKA